MNTNPGDADPVPVQPLTMNPGAKDAAADDKVQLQLAIFEVTRDAQGKSADEIREMLLSTFSRRGVKPPPNTWLDSVASAAVYGEPYIIDLPTALAADCAVPAPNEEVRRGLAARRRLRQEKLPAGIFPSLADWDIPGTEDTGRHTRPRTRGRSRAATWRAVGPRTVLAAAAFTAAAVVLVLAARKAGRHPATKAPGN